MAHLIVTGFDLVIDSISVFYQELPIPIDIVTQAKKLRSSMALFSFVRELLMSSAPLSNGDVTD